MQGFSQEPEWDVSHPYLSTFSYILKVENREKLDVDLALSPTFNSYRHCDHDYTIWHLWADQLYDRQNSLPAWYLNFSGKLKYKLGVMCYANA